MTRPRGNILVVEDDVAMCAVLVADLGRRHFAVRACTSGADALEAIGAEDFDAILTDLKMKGVDGRETTLGEVKGAKGTLVVFTCNACPWAKAWEERIVALGNEYAKKGVGVIAVNSNDPGKVAEDGYDIMKARAAEKGFAFPYVVDATSNVARAFGATRTPEAFLFDAQGRLVYHGTIDDNAQEPGGVKERYLAAKVTDTVTISKDIQVWDDSSWRVIGNVNWAVAPGFSVLLEASYGDGGDGNRVHPVGNHVKTGMLRFQRSF